jgi:hypothetical protein
MIDHPDTYQSWSAGHQPEALTIFGWRDARVAAEEAPEES